jgi:hypothetical protein
MVFQVSKILGEHVSRPNGQRHWSLLVGALLAVAMLAVLCTPGGIAPFTWGDTRASNLTPNVEYGAMAGAGPGGEIYVAYWDGGVGGTNYVLAVDPDGIYPEGGPVFTTHTQINDGGANVQTSPFWSAALAVAPNGEVYGAWIDDRDSATMGTDIRVARSTDSGATFGASVKISDFNGVNSEDYPSIAVAANGDVWVTWADDRNGNWDIMVSRSTDGGATWSSNIVVNQVTTNSRWFSKIATDSTGSVYVAWSDWRAGPVSAYYDFTRDNGATWNGNAELGVMGTMTGLPDIAVDTHDMIHAVWQDYDTQGIWYRHSFDRGLTWSMPVRLDDGRDYGDPSPRIAFTDNGDVLVTWEDRVGGTPYARYVRAYDWGLDWNSEYQYTSNPSATPTVAVDNNNNVIWAWTRNMGAPNNDEAFMLFDDAEPRPVKNLMATPLATPGSVRISWLPNAERDIAAYEIAIIDGQMFYELVATVPSTQTTYDLTGLANGEYSYGVMAVDIAGQNSQPTFVSFTVGPTLQDQIIDLQNRLDQLNTSMHDAITGLQGDLLNLQDQNTALQEQNDALQDQLTKTKDDFASSQNLNMMLMIVVIVLLIVTMALAARRPKMKVPEPAPSPAAQPPPPQQYQQPPPPQQYPPQQPPYGSA